MTSPLSPDKDRPLDFQHPYHCLSSISIGPLHCIQGTIISHRHFRQFDTLCLKGMIPGQISWLLQVKKSLYIYMDSVIFMVFLVEACDLGVLVEVFLHLKGRGNLLTIYLCLLAFLIITLFLTWLVIGQLSCIIMLSLWFTMTKLSVSICSRLSKTTLFCQGHLFICSG